MVAPIRSKQTHSNFAYTNYLPIVVSVFLRLQSADTQGRRSLFQRSPLLPSVRGRLGTTTPDRRQRFRRFWVVGHRRTAAASPLVERGESRRLGYRICSSVDAPAPKLRLDLETERG